MRARTILSLLLLTLAVWSVWCGVAVYGHAYAGSGRAELTASVVAAALCWSSGSAALLVTATLGVGPNRVAGLLLAVFCRTVVPLIITIALLASMKPLAAAGLFSYVLTFYLITLAVETGLSVWIISGSAARTAGGAVPAAGGRD